MPPKGAAKAAKAQDKAKQAAKQKAVEDKTFGLKNKNKSTKVQSQVQNLQKNVQAAGKRNQAEAPKKTKKQLEEERAKELADLFAVAVKQPKVPPGVDPKSIVCEYFKAGQCTKGSKCKFSHDLNVANKTAKRDLYTDMRDGPEEAEGMEDWTQEELEKAIRQKHAAEAGNKTDIICKFFLDAVERRLYGWFWQCPNGRDCKYRHALPPGYILKSQMKELLEEEAKNAKSIEEQIEEERQKVDARTPITEQTFKAWHDAKVGARRQEKEAAEVERKRKGIMTGREVFAQEGFAAEDDLGAADEYGRDEDEEASIQRIREEAELRNAAARAAESAASSQQPSSSVDHAPSSSSAPHMNGNSTALKLSVAEQQQLFDDDSEEEFSD